MSSRHGEKAKPSVLEMDRMALCVERSFMNALGESRMCVDGGMEVLNGGFKRKAETHLCNDVCCVSANDKGSQQLPMLFSKKKFDEALCLRCSLGFSKRLIRKFPCLVSNPFLLELTLRFSNGSNLRIAVMLP